MKATKAKRLEELAHSIAYSAAASDIEIHCHAIQLPGKQMAWAYDLSPKQFTDRDPSERQDVVLAAEYLKLRGLIEPLPDQGGRFVKILPEPKKKNASDKIPRIIVINETLGFACSLLKRSNSVWKKVPSAGILLADNRVVTVFPDHRSAREAIKRTWIYFSCRDGRNFEFSLRAAEEGGAA